MSNTFLSPANQITILRLLFIPLFAGLVLAGENGWALMMLALAILSDVADGVVARRFHQETSLGVALDPIADKILLVTSFLLLSSQRILPWWLTILVVTRDVAILTTALLISLVAGFRPFHPSIFGKLSTGAQAVTLLVALAGETDLTRIFTPLKQPAIYFAGAITFISGVHYLTLWRERSRPKDHVG